MAAEAGWYADPADPAWVRWWDGTAWSSDAQLAEPVIETVAEPPPVSVPVAAPVPVPVAAPVPVPAPAPVAVAPHVEPVSVAAAPHVTPAVVASPVVAPAVVAAPVVAPPVAAPPAPGSPAVAPPAVAPAVAVAAAVAPPVVAPAVAAAVAPPVVAPPVAVAAAVAPPVVAPPVATVPAAVPITLAAPLAEMAIPVLAPTTMRSPTPVLAPGAVAAPEPVLVAAGGIPTLEPPPVHRQPPSSVSAPIVTTAHPHLGEVGLDEDLVMAAASSFLPEIAGDTHHTTLPSPPSSAYSSSGWDSAIATGSGVARAGASTSFSGVASFEAIGGSAVVVESGSHRGVKVMVGLVVVAILVGVGVVVGLPKYRDLKAADTAAATAPLLSRTAPKSLAGQKAVSVPGLNPAAAATGATASGAGWAWAATYGTRADYTYYLAGELPPSARAAAVLAQTDPQALSRLMTELGSGVALGAASTAVLSASTEYGAGVGGKAWCMPVEVSGSGGGYCLWTNGREFLQVLNAPSIPAMSAKHTLAALKQVSATPASAPAKP